MALQKDYETNEGYTANYWRIIDINLTAKNIADSFTYLVYKDKSSRDAGKQPADKSFHKTFPIIDKNTDEVLYESPFTIEAMNTADNNPYIVAYNWLKTQPEFSGSTDV